MMHVITILMLISSSTDFLDDFITRSKKMSSSGGGGSGGSPVARIEQLDAIEKDVIAVLSSAGKKRFAQDGKNVLSQMLKTFCRSSLN